MPSSPSTSLRLSSSTMSGDALSSSSSAALPFPWVRSLLLEEFEPQASSSLLAPPKHILGFSSSWILTKRKIDEYYTTLDEQRYSKRNVQAYVTNQQEYWNSLHELDKRNFEYNIQQLIQQQHFYRNKYNCQQGKDDDGRHDDGDNGKDDDDNVGIDQGQVPIEEDIHPPQRETQTTSSSHRGALRKRRVAELEDFLPPDAASTSKGDTDTTTSSRPTKRARIPTNRFTFEDKDGGTQVMERMKLNVCKAKKTSSSLSSSKGNDNKQVKKGGTNWTAEEDTILMNAIQNVKRNSQNKIPWKTWKEISLKHFSTPTINFPVTRSGSACHHRWTMHLKKRFLNKQVEEEEEHGRVEHLEVPEDQVAEERFFLEDNDIDGGAKHICNEKMAQYLTQEGMEEVAGVYHSGASNSPTITANQSRNKPWWSESDEDDDFKLNKCHHKKLVQPRNVCRGLFDDSSDSDSEDGTIYSNGDKFDYDC